MSLAQLQIRRAVKASEFTGVKPEPGELTYAFDTKEFKVGDNAGTVWQSLPAIAGGSGITEAKAEEIDATLGLVTVTATGITALKATHFGKLLLCKAASGIIEIEVPGSIYTGTGPNLVEIARTGNAEVVWKAGTGVTLVNAATTLKLRAVGSASSLVFLAAKEALISGDLE